MPHTGADNKQLITKTLQLNDRLSCMCAVQKVCWAKFCRTLYLLSYFYTVYIANGLTVFKLHLTTFTKRILIDRSVFAFKQPQATPAWCRTDRTSLVQLSEAANNCPSHAWCRYSSCLSSRWLCSCCFCWDGHHIYWQFSAWQVFQLQLLRQERPAIE